ncbi:MAG: bifunctional 3-hydroxydecanoyl-ACP dehydratase/trans-2-decenoyl-ACP isomerase [Bdellovibrionota bacterium]
MRYEEFLAKKSFTKTELLASAWGSLVSDPPAQGVPTLPAPPMLMFDRITEVLHDGSKGRIVAEQDVALDAWFFQCHFRNDPVQPGCLGVDAIWQLLGFYAAIRGAKGAGRALGSKEIEFSGQIRPHNRVVQYVVNVRRYSYLAETGMAMVIGSGEVLVDGESIYKVNDAKVGIFAGIRYETYPHPSTHARGGLIRQESNA